MRPTTNTKSPFKKRRLKPKRRTVQNMTLKQLKRRAKAGTATMPQLLKLFRIQQAAARKCPYCKAALSGAMACPKCGMFLGGNVRHG